MLLPESGVKPIIIELALELQVYDGESFYTTKSKNFIIKPGEKIFTEVAHQYIPSNPLKPKRKFKDTLLLEFRDSFYNDGSTLNTTVQKITKDRMTHDWRGPLLITKIKGKDLFNMPTYIDFQLEDFEDVIDYLLWYGS